MLHRLFKNTYNHTPSPMSRDNWIYLSAVGHFKHEADPVPFYRDYYEGYQMFYTISGKGWLDYRGNYQHILPGTLMCINLQQRHGMGAVPGHIWEHYWVIFDGKGFEEVYNSFFLRKNIYEVKNADIVYNLYKELLDLKKADYPFFDFKSMSGILQIVSQILPSDAYQSQSESDIHYVAVKKAILYIKENYMQNIDLNDLSNYSGYSRYHLSRLFKMHTGFSPNDYIIKTRLECAKDLLLKNNLSLQVVSEYSGFHSVNYFIKTFKEWEGITPARYRKLPSL